MNQVNRQGPKAVCFQYHLFDGIGASRVHYIKRKIGVGTIQDNWGCKSQSEVRSV